MLPELAGDSEILVRRSIRSCVLVKWGSRSASRALPGTLGSILGLRGKLHLLRTTNGVPLSYELTAASVAEVCLVPELLGGVCLGENLARKFLGDLAYRSGLLGEK